MKLRVLKTTKKRKTNVGCFVFLAVSFVLATVALTGILNRDALHDYYLSLSYQPSVDMQKIRDSLDLTGYGTFLFNVAQPELANADEFNQTCRRDDDEIAVLGCYTMGKIFVYNIEEDSLAGIRELTAAHELLHAVWSKMGESERQDLADVLAQVYESDKDILEEEITIYDPSEYNEEIFVRAGTEIKRLPKILEDKYAEIFKDQDRIVDFYDSYIAVFKEIKEKMNILAEKMSSLNAEIVTKTTEYEDSVDAFNDEVVNFNRCAETAGCFSGEAEFQGVRNQLLDEQARLDGLYAEINNLVDEYNLMVAEYNNGVIESRELNDLINSSSKVEEIN